MFRDQQPAPMVSVILGDEVPGFQWVPAMASRAAWTCRILSINEGGLVGFNMSFLQLVEDSHSSTCTPWHVHVNGHSTSHPWGGSPWPYPQPSMTWSKWRNIMHQQPCWEQLQNQPVHLRTPLAVPCHPRVGEVTPVPNAKKLYVKLRLSKSGTNIQS